MFISFYTHSPKPAVSKESSWKIYTLHIFYIPKELITKTLIRFKKAHVICLTIFM